MFWYFYVVEVIFNFMYELDKTNNSKLFDFVTVEIISFTTAKVNRLN